jgi:hypothetical protein
MPSALPLPDPVAAQRRSEKVLARLPQNPVCVLCGQREPDALLPGKPVLEAQHVLGQAAAPDAVVVMCANCHRIDTGSQLDQQALPAPGRYRPRPDCLLDTIEKVLRCLAVFFESLARALISYAERLRVFIAGLDTLAPTWREHGWAQ